MQNKTYYLKSLISSGSIIISDSNTEDDIQGLILAIFEIHVPVLGTLTWAQSNLIFSKIKATSKPNSIFCSYG